MEARRGRAASVGQSARVCVLCELAKVGGGGVRAGSTEKKSGPRARKLPSRLTGLRRELWRCRARRTGDGAAGGGVRGRRGLVPAARPPVTRRTQVHLCRAVAGIKVPYGPSEGGEAGGKQLPARTKRALFQPPPLCRAAAKSPFRNCPPGARARTHAHTDRHTHTRARAHAHTSTNSPGPRPGVGALCWDWERPLGPG